MVSFLSSCESTSVELYTLVWFCYGKNIFYLTSQFHSEVSIIYLQWHRSKMKMITVYSEFR